MCTVSPSIYILMMLKESPHRFFFFHHRHSIFINIWYCYMWITPLSCYKLQSIWQQGINIGKIHKFTISTLESQAASTGVVILCWWRPTVRAGASVLWEDMRRVVANSLSSSRPLCLEHQLTLTDASSEWIYWRTLENY